MVLGVCFLTLGLIPVFCGGEIALAAASEPPAADPAPEPVLILEAVEVNGNTRTTEQTVQFYLPVRPGDRVDQHALLAAVEELRRSELFAEVDFYTRPGSERGRLVLVLEVREKGVEFRLGTGNSDLEGWYLIPAQLSADNRLGRGEQLDLQLKIGYRHAGLVLAFEQPRLGDGRSYWGLRASSLATDRIYFFEQAEYRHRVTRGSADVRFGRRLTRRLAGEIGFCFEEVKADSFATAYASDESRDIAVGDELPWEELPAEVASAAGQRRRSIAHLELRVDSRSRLRVAGSPAAGLWGRLRVAGYLQGDASFGAVRGDLRGYRRFLGGSLCGRVQARAVGERAVFYDRLYLGGLYTVRGFPSQSLTDPGGGTWLWSASCEYRAPLVGDRARPRLAGVLFVDVGEGGTRRDRVLQDPAAAVGWGLRLRVAWLGWLGLDFGIPVTPSPVEESYRAHLSIGWTF